VPIFASLLSEGLSETRTTTKQVFVSIIREAVRAGEVERVDRLLRRHISDQVQLKKLKDAASSSKDSGVGLMAGVHGGAARKSECRRCRSSGGSGAGGNVESEASEGSESSSKADTPLESALPSILSNLRSSDWLLRMEGVSALSALVQRQGEQLCRSGRLLATFDALTQQFSYANAKVNVAALQSTLQMVPVLKDHMHTLTATFVPSLAACLASSNMQVRNATPPVLDALVEHVDAAALLPTFANCALYAVPKARSGMIERLASLAAATHASKPNLVLKHALPVAFKLLDDNRTDLRAATAALVNTLHGLVGDAMLEHAGRQSQLVQQRLREAVA